METFTDLIRRLVKALNMSRCDYMFTGALAASYYGRPRTTLDVDLVIAAEERDLDRLTKWLGSAGLVVEKRKLQSALRSGDRISTLEDQKSPHTVDIIFRSQKLDRVSGRIVGLRTYYEAPESLVLAKLRMIKVTVQEERAAADRADIVSILKNTRINLRSLRRMAKTQRTARVLDDLINQARR